MIAILHSLISDNVENVYVLPCNGVVFNHFKTMNKIPKHESEVHSPPNTFNHRLSGTRFTPFVIFFFELSFSYSWKQISRKCQLTCVENNNKRYLKSNCCKLRKIQPSWQYFISICFRFYLTFKSASSPVQRMHIF